MADFTAALVIIVIVLAWMTHIIWCFTNAAWGFLLAGAIFFPIGVFHGAWLWF